MSERKKYSENTGNNFWPYISGVRKLYTSLNLYLDGNATFDALWILKGGTKCSRTFWGAIGLTRWVNPLNIDFLMPFQNVGVYDFSDIYYMGMIMDYWRSGVYSRCLRHGFEFSLFLLLDYWIHSFETCLLKCINAKINAKD